MAVKSWPAGGLTPPELDPKDPSYAQLAIAKARSVVRKIEKAEVAKLALLIHPGKGLRISPITHISLEEDVVVNRYNLLDRNFLRRKLIPGSGYECPPPVAYLICEATSKIMPMSAPTPRHANVARVCRADAYLFGIDFARSDWVAL